MITTILLSLTLIPVSFIAIFLVYKWIVFEHNKRKLAHLPGFAQMFGFKNELLTNPNALNSKYFDKYGDVYKAVFFDIGAFIVSRDPAFVKNVLVTKRTSFMKNPGLTHNLMDPGTPNLGSTTDHEEWKRRRIFLNPVFADNKVQAIHDQLMTKITQRLIDKYHQKVLESGDKSTCQVDIVTDTGSVSLDTIGLAGFGYDINSLNTSTEIPQAVRDMMKWLMLTMVVLPLWAVKLISKNLFGLFNKPLEPVRIYKKFLQGIIESRKKMDRSERAKRSDLLSSLMNEESDNTSVAPLTDRELLIETAFFMSAGHETTAATLGFTMYYIAKDKHIQDKIYEEVQPLFSNAQPDSDNVMGIDFQSLQQHTVYTQCVLKESQRLEPAAYALMRICLKDDVIEGVKIPEGSKVFLSMYSAQRDPKHWSDVLEFRPERFMGNAKIDPYVYYPFGVGPRACIGFKFAITEITLILASLIYHFEVSISPEEEAKFGEGIEFTLKPKHNYLLTLKKRKH